MREIAMNYTVPDSPAPDSSALLVKRTAQRDALVALLVKLGYGNSVPASCLD